MTICEYQEVYYHNPTTYDNIEKFPNKKYKKTFDPKSFMVRGDVIHFGNDDYRNNNKLIPLFNEFKDIKEPYNQCRQILPECYLHNGYIDILKIETLKNGSISGKNIYPYLMNKNEDIDIDTIEDWKKAEL